MAIARAASETLDEVKTRVRLEVNDSDTSSQRWGDPDVERAIFDSVRFLIREKSNRDPGELLLYEDISYSDSWTNLGSVVGSASIIKVESIESPENPYIIEYVPITILETIKGDAFSAVKVYSLSGSGTNRQIGIRSTSTTSFNIRIWYLAEAITPNGDDPDDLMPLQTTWLRLVQLHAAKALRSIEGEWTQQQESNLQEYIHLWKSHRQAGGPRMIPARRRN